MFLEKKKKIVYQARKIVSCGLCTDFSGFLKIYNDRLVFSNNV
jgi:hypothetical protein